MDSAQYATHQPKTTSWKHKIGRNVGGNKLMFKNKTKQPSCRTNFSHIFLYTQPKTKATYIVHRIQRLPRRSFEFEDWYPETRCTKKHHKWEYCLKSTHFFHCSSPFRWFPRTSVEAVFCLKFFFVGVFPPPPPPPLPTHKCLHFHLH
jgi:hypothetical protein